MKKFEGILICTDLDGTLLRRDCTVSRENLEAIEHFKAEDGFFTFITGRMPFFVSRIYEAVKPNAPFGCINGGGIYDHREGRYMWTKSAPRSVLTLVEYVDRHIADIGIQVNTFERIYFCKENEAMMHFRHATGVPNLVRAYTEIDEPIAKIVFGDTKEENIRLVKELLDAHPMADEFDFIRSEKTLYEILPKNTSKGTVLPKLAESLGVDMKRTVAVGDYNNDIGMLRAAGFGIAVANACPEAKAAADYITVSNEEHAIARIVSELENGTLTL